MPPRLILNADDFGLTPGINHAILALHHAGVLTSASLMATGPAFAHAAELALATPTLGIGCHLVFVDGIPISHPHDIPTLLGADGTTFRPTLTDFAQAAIRGTISPQDIARETQAQIQRLQRAGLDVTHIDTHKHTHLFPSIAAPVLHIAGRCGVHAIRNPYEPAWSANLAPIPLTRRLQLRALTRFQPAIHTLLEPIAEREQLPSATLGIAATGHLTAPLLRRMLLPLCTADDQSTYELCLHPGHLDSQLDRENTRLRASRELEVAALLQVIPEIKRTRHAPAFIHYGNLGIPGLQRASGQFTPFTGYEKVT